MKPAVLIFSKDRPAQLDLLLRSIERFAPAFYSSRVVLWRDSAPEYRAGYRICASEHPEVGWWREERFEANVRWWLEQAGGLCSFLVDDDVFYREAEWDGTVSWSLRGGDYDYPFSVDGNIYRTESVVRMIRGLRFTDPTELEARAHEVLTRDGSRYSVPHGTPCLVGLPANRVSTSSHMPYVAQQYPHLHEYELNERYLKGDRIRLPEIDPSESLPAHFSPFDFDWTSDRVTA